MASSEGATGTPANNSETAAGTVEAAAVHAPLQSADAGSTRDSGNATTDATPRSASTEGGRGIADGIRISCLMNARYHASREAFLDNVHRWFMFAVIVLGAGALIDVGVKEFPWAKEAFGAFAAIIAALDLTFDLSNRARTHAMMKRRYFELLADFGEDKRTAEETRACINRFGADEEPAYHALLQGSWNAAQEMVYGKMAYRCDIPWWHRWSQHFIRYGSSHYALVKRPNVSAS